MGTGTGTGTGTELGNCNENVCLWPGRNLYLRLLKFMTKRFRIILRRLINVKRASERENERERRRERVSDMTTGPWMDIGLRNFINAFARKLLIMPETVKEREKERIVRELSVGSTQVPERDLSEFQLRILGSVSVLVTVLDSFGGCYCHWTWMFLDVGCVVWPQKCNTLVKPMAK